MSQELAMRQRELQQQAREIAHLVTQGTWTDDKNNDLGQEAAAVLNIEAEKLHIEFGGAHNNLQEALKSVQTATDTGLASLKEKLKEAKQIEAFGAIIARVDSLHQQQIKLLAQTQQMQQGENLARFLSLSSGEKITINNFSDAQTKDKIEAYQKALTTGGQTQLKGGVLIFQPGGMGKPDTITIAPAGWPGLSNDAARAGIAAAASPPHNWTKITVNGSSGVLEAMGREAIRLGTIESITFRPISTTAAGQAKAAPMTPGLENIAAIFQYKPSTTGILSNNIHGAWYLALANVPSSSKQPNRGEQLQKLMLSTLDDDKLLATFSGLNAENRIDMFLQSTQRVQQRLAPQGDLNKLILELYRSLNTSKEKDRLLSGVSKQQRVELFRSLNTPAQKAEVLMTAVELEEAAHKSGIARFRPKWTYPKPVAKQMVDSLDEDETHSGTHQEKLRNQIIFQYEQNNTAIPESVKLALGITEPEQNADVELEDFVTPTPG